MIDESRSSTSVTDCAEPQSCITGHVVASSSATLENMPCRRTCAEKFMAASVAFAMQWVVARACQEGSGVPTPRAKQQQLLECTLPIAQAFMVSTARQLTTDEFVRELCNANQNRGVPSSAHASEEQHRSVWSERVRTLLEHMVDMEQRTTNTRLTASDLLLRCPYISTAADTSFFQVIVELTESRSDDLWREVIYRARKPKRSCVFHALHSVIGPEVCGVMAISADPAVHLYVVHASGAVGQMLVRFDSIGDCIAYMRSMISAPSSYIVMMRSDGCSTEEEELRSVARAVCTIASHFQPEEFEPVVASAPAPSV